MSSVSSSKPCSLHGVEHCRCPASQQPPNLTPFLALSLLWSTAVSAQACQESGTPVQKPQAIEKTVMDVQEVLQFQAQELAEETRNWTQSIQGLENHEILTDTKSQIRCSDIPDLPSVLSIDSTLVAHHRSAVSASRGWNIPTVFLDISKTYERVNGLALLNKLSFHY